MSGPLRYLDSSPVLISRAWAWRETTAGPQPKQTDSWSARHAMQRHRVREGPTHMRGLFCCLCVRQHERMPFHTERWKFPCERQQLQFNNLIEIWLWIWLQHLVRLGLFLYVSLSFYKEPRIYTSKKILAKLVVDHFMAGCFDIISCGIIYSLCGHKTRPRLTECHNCLSPHLLNWMTAHGTKQHQHNDFKIHHYEKVHFCLFKCIEGDIKWLIYLNALQGVFNCLWNSISI